MAECIKLRRKQKRVCIGSLNHKIIITVRGIRAPVGDNPNFTEEFTEPRSVWAMIETINPKDMFDDTNIIRIKTHYFSIRKPVDDVTIVNWITYRGINYNILRIENLNEDDSFLKITSNVKGPATVPANEA